MNPKVIHAVKFENLDETKKLNSSVQKDMRMHQKQDWKQRYK